MTAAPHGKPSGRGFWPLRDLPVVMWLVMLLAATVLHPVVPAPRWLMIHLLLLGAVTHAIFVWSTHFTETLLDRQQAFGYTQEDIKFLMSPMAVAGEEGIGSMGNDSPLAVLSDKNKPLYNYFKQLFAQVTNPPIDPIREELVMSLVSMIGPRPNLLGHHAGSHYRLEVAQPVLTNADLAKIRGIAMLAGDAFRTATLDATWLAADGAAVKGEIWIERPDATGPADERRR